MDVSGVTEQVADEAAVDAVLTASRTLVAVATQSLGAAAEDTTLAQYRRWWCSLPGGRSGWATWRRRWMSCRPLRGGCATGCCARA